MKSDLWVEEQCGDYAAQFKVTGVLFLVRVHFSNGHCGDSRTWQDALE